MVPLSSRCQSLLLMIDGERARNLLLELDCVLLIIECAMFLLHDWMNPRMEQDPE